MTCDRPRSEVRRERLVARAARGEQAAREEVREILRPLLLTYCRSLLRDPESAPEVVEETLGDVESALPVMRERRAPFPSWAYGLAADRIRLVDRDPDVVGNRLTDRERAVAEGLGEGRSPRELARSLFMSERTLSTHYRNVVRKSARQAQDEAVASRWEEDREAGSMTTTPEEDQDELGDLDLHAARAALLADLRLTVRDHHVPSRFDRAEAEARTELRGGLATPTSASPGPPGIDR